LAEKIVGLAMGGATRRTWLSSWRTQSARPR